jgi:endonuclease III
MMTTEVNGGQGSVASTQCGEPDLAARARKINAHLLAAYGPPPPRQQLDPLAELVATILSQHTSDINTERAFASLLDRFGDFEAVRVAPVEAIEAAIRGGGLSRVKAPRIKRVLDQIASQRGNLSLGFLHDLDLGEARAFLTGLDGVGPKTAACVLLFACGKPAIPVDTHVHRVSRRLGLIGPRLAAAPAHAALETLVPPDQAYAFHMNLIRLGRQTCKAQRPRCAKCPLLDLCPRVGVEAPARGRYLDLQV